jgi:anti-anti-sigma factor
MPARLSVSVTGHHGMHTVRLTGELDVATAPKLAAVLTELRGPIVVDCTKLTFVDVSGARVLADTARAHGELALRNAAPFVRRVLDGAGSAPPFVEERLRRQSGSRRP